jgi:hypothetical protein
MLQWTTKEKQLAAEARREAAEAAQFEEEEARQLAVGTDAVVFEGQPMGEPHADTMGGFSLVRPLLMMNRRGVWCAAHRAEVVRVWYGSSKKWLVGSEASMRAGKDVAWMTTANAEPDALTPVQVKGGWMASHGKGWVAAPNVRMRQVSKGGRAHMSRYIYMHYSVSAHAPS